MSLKKKRMKIQKWKKKKNLRKNEPEEETVKRPTGQVKYKKFVLHKVKIA